MSDQLADHYLRQQEQMEAVRGVWEGHWREVAQLVWPTADMFQQRIRADGDKRNQRLFDDTAPLALNKYTAAVISMAMPSTQTYHKLQPHDPVMAKNDKVMRYCDNVNDFLFRMRYRAQANFQSQSSDVVMSTGAFGTGIMFIDDMPGIGARYKSYPLAETYLQEDGHGTVDTLSRKFQLTAHQAVTLWANDNLPQAIRDAYEKQPLTKFWFMHAVGPNPDRQPGRMTYEGMAFKACYVACEQRQTISEGGFRTFPFATPRFETAPREVYGRSPAMKVLPTIKTLNEMKKTIIRAGQMAVSPPIMLTDDAALSPFNVRSNALNHGYLDDQGRPKAMPFNSQARVDIGLELIQAEREAINDAFFVTLFRILEDEPQITATEAMLRAQEKGQLLTPTMGRIQSEFLGPTVDREIDIYSQPRVGGSMLEQACGPMPDALIESGGMLKLEYCSPLNQAQQAGEGAAIMNSLNALGPLAQIDPTVARLPDAHGIFRRLWAINGAHADLLHSEEDVVAASEQDAQQAQMQQLLAAAPVAASAAKDFAQAGALAGSSPNSVAPQLLPAGSQ